MAGRGRTTFQKRQKEQKRLERRQAKAARKEARKAGLPETEQRADDLVMREELSIEEAAGEVVPGEQDSEDGEA